MNFSVTEYANRSARGGKKGDSRVFRVVVCYTRGVGSARGAIGRFVHVPGGRFYNNAFHWDTSGSMAVGW